MIVRMALRVACKAEDLYCHALKGPGSKVICDAFDSWLLCSQDQKLYKQILKKLKAYAAGKK